jgi:predicted MFS family arabinose efflux permease
MANWQAGEEPGGAAEAGLSEAVSRATVGRPLLIMFLARTGLNTAHRIVYPFLPSLARGLDVSLEVAGVLVTVRLVAGLAAPFLGPVADRFGRRRTMEIALVLVALGSLVLVGLGSFAGAVAAFALYGLAKVLYDPAVYAYLGDTVPYHRRARVVGALELSWSNAWLLGVPVSGLLIERFGWRAPWAVLIAAGLLGAGLTHAGLPAGGAVGPAAGDTPFVAEMVKRWRDLLRQRRVVVLLVSGLLLMAALEVPFIVYGAWLESAFGLSLSSLGLASIAVGVAEASAELGTTVITDRLGKKRSVVLGLLGLAASLAALPSLAEQGLLAAMAGVVLMMLTFEFSIVSLLPLATEVAPRSRASLMALNVTAMSLGRIVGAVAGGWLWGQLGGITPNALAGAALALLAAAAMGWGMAEYPLPLETRGSDAFHEPPLHEQKDDEGRDDDHGHPGQQPGHPRLGDKGATVQEGQAHLKRIHVFGSGKDQGFQQRVPLCQKGQDEHRGHGRPGEG